MARGFWRGAMVTLLLLSMLSTAMVQGVAARQAQETQPVGMVSGPWRMMAWQFAFANVFPAQGLEARDGANWGVLVADITNTGVGAAFLPSQVELADTGITGDDARSATVSTVLGLTGLAADGTVQIAENGIARVAIVLDVPEGVGEPVITIGEESVRVESVMTDAISTLGLPAFSAEMAMQQATVRRETEIAVLDIRLRTGDLVPYEIGGGSEVERMKCRVEIPDEIVVDTVGEYVLIEDASDDGAAGVWVADRDLGHLVLVDQLMVDGGLVMVEADDDAPYSQWLASRTQWAEQMGVGLHNAPCAEDSASTSAPPTPDPTPRPEPTPRPTEASASSGSGLVIESLTGEQDEYGLGLITVYVEVTNYTSETFDYVGLEGTCRNGAGNVVGTGIGNTLNVRPGETVVITMIFFDAAGCEDVSVRFDGLTGMF